MNYTMASWKSKGKHVFYHPNPVDLMPLDNKELDAILDAIKLVVDRLPWRIYGENMSEFNTLEFYCDEGMKNSSILGYTQFFNNNRVLLNPVICNGLTHKNNAGIPNNEIEMNTIIHELTHLRQMRFCHGLLWPIINSPIIRDFTVEKWACENGSAATKILTESYDILRS